MKKSRFSEHQITKILKEVEAGRTAKDVCREYCTERGFTWDGLYERFSRVSCFCCPLQGIGELRKCAVGILTCGQKYLRWNRGCLWEVNSKDLMENLL